MRELNKDDGAAIAKLLSKTHCENQEKTVAKVLFADDPSDEDEDQIYEICPSNLEWVKKLKKDASRTATRKTTTRLSSRVTASTARYMA